MRRPAISLARVMEEFSFASPLEVRLGRTMNGSLGQTQRKGCRTKGRSVLGWEQFMATDIDVMGEGGGGGGREEHEGKDPDAIGPPRRHSGVRRKRYARETNTQTLLERKRLSTREQIDKREGPCARPLRAARRMPTAPASVVRGRCPARPASCAGPRTRCCCPWAAGTTSRPTPHG